MCSSFSGSDASRFSIHLRCLFSDQFFEISDILLFLLFDCFFKGAFECILRTFLFDAFSISSGAACKSRSSPIILAAGITNCGASI